MAKARHHFIGDLHKHFGRTLMALICVHIVGVPYHEYVQGDRLLVRILPRRANEWWLRLSKPEQA